MKLFIILATVLNVFLMTHSSSKEEKILIELGDEKNTITDQKNTDVRINMNDSNSNTYVINPEEINFAEVNSSSKDNILAIIKKRGSHADYKVPSCAQMNGEEQPCIKETDNCKWDPVLETCNDGPGLPRLFPLFTTFNYGETTQANNILIELKEEEAIQLHMMSNTFKDICDVGEGQEHNEYCEAVYLNENSAMYQDRVNSCKQIRSVDFTGNKVGAHFNQVHFTHMTKILEYVRTKGGVAPPTTSKSYVQKVTATSIEINPEYVSGQNFDVTFVNGIWETHKQDVGYILNAAMYLDINCLSQLMGARIAQGIEATSTDDAEFEKLASIKLDNAFLHAEL
jgi:hypothetical protein